MAVNHKNLRAYNLNALPALREILRYGSLTKAAAALNLTQPALSNILKQLRRDFGDELVIRSGNEMQLTPRGEEMMAPLEQTLISVEQLLSASTFDPAVSKKQFRIATTDHVMSVISGLLLTRLASTAPGISAQLLIAQVSSIKDLVIGDIDMIITPRILLSAGLADNATYDQMSQEALFSEAMVCIGHEDDGTLSLGLTTEEYLARPHAGYHFGAARLSSLEQVQLARLSLKQNNTLLVSSYSILPGIVAETGCLALIPESLARTAKSMLPIQIVTPPISLPLMEWVMVWHNRNDQDSAHRWLRSSLHTAATPFAHQVQPDRPWMLADA